MSLAKIHSELCRLLFYLFVLSIQNHSGGPTPPHNLPTKIKPVENIHHAQQIRSDVNVHLHLCGCNHTFGQKGAMEAPAWEQQPQTIEDKPIK